MGSTGHRLPGRQEGDSAGGGRGWGWVSQRMHGDHLTPHPPGE